MRKQHRLTCPQLARVIAYVIIRPVGAIESTARNESEPLLSVAKVKLTVIVGRVR